MPINNVGNLPSFLQHKTELIHGFPRDFDTAWPDQSLAKIAKARLLGPFLWHLRLWKVDTSSREAPWRGN